jgi:hypothetical protein
MHPFQNVAARYDVQVRLRPLPDGREEFGQLICFTVATATPPSLRVNGLNVYLVA